METYYKFLRYFSLRHNKEIDNSYQHFRQNPIKALIPKIVSSRYFTAYCSRCKIDNI
jgi:hypothetical protein